MRLTGEQIDIDEDEFIHEPDDLLSRPARTRPSSMKWIIVASLIIALLPTLWMARGQGMVTKLVRIVYPSFRAPNYAPRVIMTTPESGAFGIPVDSEISIDLKLSRCEIDRASVNNESVILVRTGDQKPIPATVTTSSTQVVLKPAKALEPLTGYTVHLSDSIKDTHGKNAAAFCTSFTTAGDADHDIRFQKVALPPTKGKGVTCVKVGPDGKLYCGTDVGLIVRYEIKSDGTLGEPQVIKSLQEANKGPRILLGFDFDKASTSENPIIWATNSYFGFTNVPDFTGKVTRISGPNLEKVEDVIVNLPRAIKDHQTMQPSFGPDGALYFCQASNSAMGAPDKDWGFRKEHLLNATILRLDTTKVKPGHPIDAKTADCGGSYDPNAKDAPLTIYATGVRLAYDLCWHSNGNLYAPTNGSSDGGNTPTGNGVIGLNDVPWAEDDWLHKIEKGKYYGHPNPAQNHIVFNGGRVDASWSFGQVPQYPIGTMPEKDWQPATWDLGPHISADGCVEYLGNAFNGKLNHKLLICRYNWGSDLVAIGFGEKGNAISAQSGFEGMKNFESPLDVTEDLRNGNLYVSEYGARKLTLLKPAAPGSPLNNAPEQTRTRLAKPYSDKG